MNKKTAENKSSLGTERAVGLAYHAPRVMDYGDLADLTQAKGGTTGDGGAPRTRV